MVTEYGTLCILQIETKSFNEDIDNKYSSDKNNKIAFGL